MELLVLASGAVLLAGCLFCVGIGPRRPCDLVTGSVTVALALVVLIGKLLLVAGIFRPVPVAVTAMAAAVVAACWLAASRAARRRALAALGGLSGLRRIRFAPVGCVAAAAALALVGYEAAMGARLPPVSWDSLYYHLISVAEWVRTGHMVAPLPGLSRHNPVYAYFHADSFPKDDELTAAWFAAFTHSTRLVGLAQVVYAPLLFGGVYGICRHLRVRAGLAVVSAAIVTLTPAVVQELATNYVDVAGAAAVLAAWAFLLSAFSDADEQPAPRVQNLVLAGIAFALAAGIKSTNLEYCAVALAIAFGLCIRESRRAMRAPRLDGLPEPALPATARCMTAIAVPMIALGSFWYIRSWLVWGSPLWPVQVGPFPGVVSAAQFTSVGGLQVPPPLRNSGGLVLVARSWLFPALSLGDIWLGVLLPAIAVVTVLAIWRRRTLLIPVLTAVAPLFLLDLTSPGAWSPRFEIPMVGAGAVALALVCEAIAAPGVTVLRRVPRRRAGRARTAALRVDASWPLLTVPSPPAPRAAEPAATRARTFAAAGAAPLEVGSAFDVRIVSPPDLSVPGSAGPSTAGAAGAPGTPGRRPASHRRSAPQVRLAGMPYRATAVGGRVLAAALSAAALALAGTTAWAAANSMSDWQPTPTVRSTLQLLKEPALARENVGPWDIYDAMNTRLSAPGAVAFFANSAPDFALPLAGMDFRRGVVVLPPYAPEALASSNGSPRQQRRLERAVTVRFRTVVAQMQGLGARYLFVSMGSLTWAELAEYTPAQLQLVFTLPEGPVYELTDAPRSPAAG